MFLQPFKKTLASALPGRPACLASLACLAFPALLAAAAESAPQPIPDTIAQRALACAGCHGKEGRASSAGYFPRIAGKPAGYLYNQLRNFRDGRRGYPMMVYIVSPLSDAYLQELAQYFADQHPPYPAPQPLAVSPAVAERGRQLAQQGDPGRNVPACVSCHGKALTGVAPAIPGLLGLPRDYLSAQFGAWKNGARHAAAPDCMATIASRLSMEEISAVSAWLASQPVADPGLPQSALAAPLPLECGSMREARP